MKQLIYATCIFTALAAISTPAFADGPILINQAAVMAAGGFPYVITQTGSYRLSENLVNDTVNATMIAVKAANVTLDFDGFTVNCQACTKSSAEVVTSNTLGTTLMNGTIAVPAGSIDTNATTCIALRGPNARVVNMTLDWCLLGITDLIGGNSLTVSNTMFYGIGGDCLKTDTGLLTVTNSTFDSCGLYAIFTSSAALITGNTFLSGTKAVAAVYINPTATPAAGATVTNNVFSGGQHGVLGPAGVGSNTFISIGNNSDISGGTSMKNNVCSGGSGC